MNRVLKFLSFYIIMLASIFSFYFTIVDKYEKELNITAHQLTGIEYLRGLYKLSIGLIEIGKYKENMGAADANILNCIDDIYVLQKKYPEYKNISLNEKLESIKKQKLNEEEYYDFLDSINHENYTIGDISELLFEEDRKLYFISSLVTHYMPEYLISILITHNIVEEYHENGQVSKLKQRLYIEQNKLTELSLEEIDGIVKLLKVYKSTQKLSLLTSNLIKKLHKLPQDTSAILSLNNSDKKFDNYLDISHDMIELSYQLNDMNINILESSLKSKKAALNKKILLNRILVIFVFILITGVTLYFYRVYSSNEKKEIELKNNNKILDKLVIFSKTDKNGVITYVSTALERLSGYSRDELIGKTHAVLKDDSMEESVSDDLWNTILNKKIWTGEIKNKTKFNSSYWVKLTAIPELDDNNEITGFISYREDITYQKEIEKEKQRTLDALEFKSKFLSNMSHEIRTPLNGIIGLTYIALKTDLDEKQKDLIKKIKSASNILLGVINDILDISKIESGKMSIEKAPIDLKESIEDIKDFLAAKATEKGICLNIDYSGISEYHRQGDSLRISQIITNLLSNAVKFTSSGKVTLKIIDLGNELVRFDVIDTGIGLKKDAIETLFEEFTQADMSTSRKYGGTGLGLSISKKLVEMMGGRIWVTSEFGVGSTFSFELPLKICTAYEKSNTDNLNDMESLEKKLNAIEGVNILVAEDNKMNQMILTMLLEKSKLNLDFALDGAIAVEKFKQNNYDLILMDVQMPNMNGYEATKAIREISLEIPIIALSANVMQEDVKRSLESGMNDHLAKPIEVNKLYTTLLKYINKN